VTDILTDRPTVAPTTDCAEDGASGRPRGPSLGWVLGTGALWLVCGLLGLFFFVYVNKGVHGVDSHAYWLTAHRASLYGAAPGSRDAYLYSPVFSSLIWPVALLPWQAFMVLWMAAEVAAFVWLLAPMGIRWGVPVFCLCLIEVGVGNIYAFFAVVAVLGLSRPGMWALPLLTKITPGLGPVWFAVRREWRALWICTAVTLAVVAVSVALAPHLWVEWYRFLSNNAGGNQLFLPGRVVAAVALTVVGARKGKPWLLAPAMLLANPVVLHSWMEITILAAIPRLRRIQMERTDAAVPARAEMVGAVNS